MFKESSLEEASCDSSINSMEHDTHVEDYETVNLFELKKDFAKISSSFQTLILIEIRASSVPFKPSSVSNLEPEFIKSCAIPFVPAAIMGRLLATSPPSSNDQFFVGIISST